MSQEQNTTSRKKGQHLTIVERKIIERLLKLKVPPKEIAEAIGISESTLSSERRRGEKKVERIVREKELKRNYYQGGETVVREWVYIATAAQADADAKKSSSVKHFKIFNEPGYVELVEELVLSNPKQYSPDTANAEARKRGFKGVSTKTLYNWIEAGLLKIQPMDLLLKVRRKPPSKIRIQKREYGKSIDERPETVKNREEFGHFEGDSIVGKDHKGQIITLVERKTRTGYMFVFKDRKAKNMVSVLRKLKKRYGEQFCRIFKSITFDNGSEFAYNEKMSRYCEIYYAHAYRSCERASNENYNGIVRRFIPKSSDITVLRQRDIERVNHYINTMPRKILGYKTALEMFASETASLLEPAA